MANNEPKTDEIRYRELMSELAGIVDKMQDDAIDIDQALEQYERGLEIISRLDERLRTAENRIVELKARFDKRTAGE